MNGEAGKVVINLATGLEDAERLTVAFLVGVAAVDPTFVITIACSVGLERSAATTPGTSASMAVRSPTVSLPAA